MQFIKRFWGEIVLGLLVTAYIVYFSYFSVLRMHTLYASYYDLGIMNQNVYNTYQAIRTGDFSRVLEMTDTDDTVQIKRMAIHDDIILAFLAPFYFIYAGPETLLVIQSVVLGLGAIMLFAIGKHVFGNKRGNTFIPLTISFCYLLYSPMEKSNQFDFHAVVLATTLLLAMFYFWLKKKYIVSFICMVLALMSKEQVSLSTFFFAIYTWWSTRNSTNKRERKKQLWFSGVMVILSVMWAYISVAVVTPLFRGRHHFALDYYGDFGDSPITILIGLFKHPYSVIQRVFRKETFMYLFQIFGPLAFISLLSPLVLVIALPEFGVNILSSQDNMRNIYYHYTAVLTPFIFIAAVYGTFTLVSFIEKRIEKLKKVTFVLVPILIFCTAVWFAYQEGPLPFTKGQLIHPFKYPAKEAKDTELWARILKNEKLIISTTGQLSPFFTSRRVFYDYSARYVNADYVLVRLNEIYNYPEKDKLIPVYEKMKVDPNFKLIYKRDNFEVYKKV